MGITFAMLSLSGTIPVFKDKLLTNVIYTPSKPGLLPFLSLETILTTSFVAHGVQNADELLFVTYCIQSPEFTREEDSVWPIITKYLLKNPSSGLAGKHEQKRHNLSFIQYKSQLIIGKCLSHYKYVIVIIKMKNRNLAIHAPTSSCSSTCC